MTQRSGRLLRPIIELDYKARDYRPVNVMLITELHIIFRIPSNGAKSGMLPCYNSLAGQ